MFCLAAALLLNGVAAAPQVSQLSERELRLNSPTYYPTPAPFANNTMCHLKINMNSCNNCVAAGCVFCKSSPSSCYSSKPGAGVCSGTSYQASGLSASTINDLCDGTLAKQIQTAAIVGSVFGVLCCIACISGVIYFIRMQRIRQQQQWGTTYVTSTQQPGAPGVYPRTDIIPNPIQGQGTVYPVVYAQNAYPQQQQQQPPPVFYPAQQYPAQPYPAQPYPAQQYPAQQYPDQPSPYPAQPQPSAPRDFNFELEGQPNPAGGAQAQAQAQAQAHAHAQQPGYGQQQPVYAYATAEPEPSAPYGGKG